VYQLARGTEKRRRRRRRRRRRLGKSSEGKL